MTEDILRLTAVEMSGLLKNRDVSAMEILEAHLARIEECNPTINAIVALSEDVARTQAQSVDDRLKNGETVGPLAGLPVGIKDTIDTKGIRTTHGSPLFADHVPDRDDIMVERVKQADAVIIGKTNTPEFAIGGNTVNRVFGATRNPWNTKLSPGGSTGGGAAGLASCMFPLTLGSDLGGSLRIPASFCGIVGLRPTVGVVPTGPSALPFEALGVSGPMARSPEDIKLMMDVIAHPHSSSPLTQVNSLGLPTIDVKVLNIAYVPDIAGIGIDPEVLETCEAAAESLKNAGFAVSNETLDLSEGRETFTTLRGQVIVNAYLSYLNRMDQLEPNLIGNIEKGLNQTPQDIAVAENKRAQLWTQVTECLQVFDLILTPTLPITPFPVEDNYPDFINGKKMASYIDWVAPTMIISLFGIPAVSVPVGLSEDGLPVGLQIIGNKYSETKLLSLAAEIQAQNPIGWAPN